MKTRKFLSLALALALCLSLLPTTSLAVGDFEITDGILIKYNGPGGDVVIPSGVTAIGERAFLYCSSLTSVTIPNSVTSIGSSAFSECTSLTDVTIPGSVTSIGSSAFSECINLTSVTLGEGLTSIGSSAFYCCTSLTSITIPYGVTTIGMYAFSECNSLTSAVIPYGVTVIEKGTFYGCTGLTSVTIPDTVTDINSIAFYTCTGLTSITIPDSVTYIGHSVFTSCTGLTSITIPNSVTTIDSGAFDYCSGLTSVTIPPEVTCLENISVPSGCEIKGAPGSCAQYWAEDEGYKFVADRPFATTPSRTAYASTQKVSIDGKQVEFQMYALKDEAGNLTNYIKLRDLAYALNGTAAQFQVGFDNGVIVTSKTPYTANGSEMKTPFSGNRTYLDGSRYLRLNGSRKNISDFTLRDDNGGGYTYYKLRDIGEVLGFNVGWSASKGVFVETDKPYISAN